MANNNNNNNNILNVKLIFHGALQYYSLKATKITYLTNLYLYILYTNFTISTIDKKNTLILQTDY